MWFFGFRSLALPRLAPFRTLADARGDSTSLHPLSRADLALPALPVVLFVLEGADGTDGQRGRFKGPD